jgi:tetratricopeptide (TPR) repeat protein
MITIVDRDCTVRFSEECAATGDALLVRLAEAVCDGDGELQEGVSIGRRRDGDAHYGGLLLVRAERVGEPHGIASLTKAMADADGRWSLAAVSPESITIARGDVDPCDSDLAVASAEGALRFARSVLRETARWSSLGFERSHRAAKTPRQDEFWLVLAERWEAFARERADGVEPAECATIESAMEWLKRRGNFHFGAGRHATAARIYEAAILDLERGDGSEGARLAPLLSNLSAAQHKLGRFRAAAATARRCTVANPAFAKGYFRRAKALLALAESTGDVASADEALVAITTGCARFGDNATMRQLHDRVRSVQSALAGKKSKKHAVRRERAAPAPSRAASATSVAAATSAEAQEDESWYTLHAQADGTTRVVFDCAQCAETTPSAELLRALVARPVHARGGRFDLTVGAGRAGTVECVFESPRPDSTARAIATRLRVRAEDPTQASDAAEAACAVC